MIKVMRTRIVAATEFKAKCLALLDEIEHRVAGCARANELALRVIEPLVVPHCCQLPAGECQRRQELVTASAVGAACRIGKVVVDENRR